MDKKTEPHKADPKKNLRYQRGVDSETLAQKLLISKGYTILKHRYKTPYGEIDVIACKDMLLAVVEVKFRKKLHDAMIAVTDKQKSRIIQATQFFLQSYPEYLFHMIRFDFIAICPYKDPKHFENMWEEPCS